MLCEKLHNECELIEQLRSGSEKAFTLLYQHYSWQLYLNIHKMVRDPDVAQDMVQELFTRVWQHRQRETLLENFSAYLYRIAVNLVHDFFRKLQRDKKLLANFTKLASENYWHVEGDVDFRASSQAFEEAFRKLSPQQKKVYELVRHQGLSYKRTAEVMNISPFTVKEYLSNTTKSLKRLLIRHIGSVIILLSAFLKG